MIQKKLQLKKWRNSLVDLLLPPQCHICGHSLASHDEQALCSTCFNEVKYIGKNICSLCGLPISGDITSNHLCQDCLVSGRPYRFARSITFYEQPVNVLLHRLKYHFDGTVFDPLLRIARGFDFSLFYDCDIILPVPLYVDRLKKRGMNQALLLARLFFPEQKNRINHSLFIRSRDTISQTTLDSDQRKANLKNAFLVKDTDIIDKKSICLVDDVFTTGTTVNECSKTLIRSGAREVRVLTMARVRKKGV